MSKFTNWMAATLLLATSHVAVAQHGGRGTGGTGGASSASYPHDTDSDIKDIQKAFAIQATEEQKHQFQSWNRDTEVVKSQIQDLRAAAVTNDFSNQLSALKAANEKSESGYRDFVRTLTEAQHKGLKKTIQRIGKANDDLAKAVATAIRDFVQANSGTERAAKLAHAQTAVENLLNEQKRIAVEMSIGS